MSSLCIISLVSLAAIQIHVSFEREAGVKELLVDIQLRGARWDRVRFGDLTSNCGSAVWLIVLRNFASLTPPSGPGPLTPFIFSGALARLVPIRIATVRVTFYQLQIDH